MLEANALTERSRSILLALTSKVRFFTLEQVARTWWPSSNSGRSAAQATMTKLVTSGYLAERKLPAHPELLLRTPVHEWAPGDGPPNFGALAYRLQARWTESLTTITLYHATQKTASRFGGFGGRLKFPLQATHDLHVSQIYLTCLDSNPDVTQNWVSEEVLSTTLRPKRGDKLPDAALIDPDGRMRLVVEFGGSYDRKRVEKLHRYCERQEVPYHLW